MKMTKKLNQLEEANQFQNCPLVRQMTFKHIDYVKKEIIFRIKLKTLLPYEKFIDVKKPNIIQFDHLLLTLIETLYYLNKQGIYIEKQSQLFISVGDREVIGHLRDSTIDQELKLRIKEILQKNRITCDLILKQQIELEIRGELLLILGTLNQRLQELYKYVSKLAKLQIPQAQDQQIWLNFKLMELLYVFTDITKSSKDQNDQQKQKQGNYEEELNNFFRQLCSFDEDFAIITLKIKKLVSEYVQRGTEQTAQVLTPLEQDLKVLTLINYSYGLYLQQLKSETQETQEKYQEFRYQQVKIGKICEAIKSITPPAMKNDSISDMIQLDWDLFSINLMNITKRKDKGFKSQIIIIKNMINYFVQSNTQLQNYQDFKELKILKEYLTNEKLDMKLLIKHTYIKRLLKKQKLVEQFAQLDEQGYLKFEHFYIKKSLEKSFYKEMKVFYNVKGSSPHDVSLQFHSDAHLSDLRILQIRIHVLKELKSQTKQLFKHKEDIKHKSILIINNILLVYYLSTQRVIQNLSQHIDHEQFRAEFNKEERKNFLRNIQNKIDKLKQTTDIGTNKTALQNLSEMDNQSLINGSFGSIIQCPEIATKFNLLVKYYRTSYEQIHSSYPTRETFDGYTLYGSLKFLIAKSMPYRLESLQLELPYDYDYEEYYTIIRNGGTSYVIELMYNNSSHHEVKNKKGQNKYDNQNILKL